MLENWALDIIFKKARYQENPEMGLVYKKSRYHENPGKKYQKFTKNLPIYQKNIISKRKLPKTSWQNNIKN